MNLRTALEDYDKADDVLFECKERLASIFTPILQYIFSDRRHPTFRGAKPCGDGLILEYEWTNGDWDHIVLPIAILDAENPLEYAKTWHESQKASMRLADAANRLREAENALTRAKEVYEEILNKPLK